MPIPGTNIRTLRQQANMSLNDLAAVTGMNKGNLSNLETGKISYSHDVLEKIARALNVSMGVLFSDVGIVEAAALQMRQVPLLTKVQLPMWRGPEDFEFPDEQVFLHFPLNRASRHVFALTIDDMKNAPSLLPDDQVIFDPKQQPREGSFVVAQGHAGDIFVGRLHILPIPKGPHFEVLPVGFFAGAVSTMTDPELQLRGAFIELRRTAL